MSQDKDNNEAASALSSAILNLPFEPIGYSEKEKQLLKLGHRSALSAAAELVAASASQSSTPVPRMGGPDEGKTIDTFEFTKVLGTLLGAHIKRSRIGASGDPEWMTAYGAFVDYIDNFVAHVARQRQESAPACAVCGGTRFVDDGEINCYSNGEPFTNGPVKCVKDCPSCATPSAAVAEGVDTVILQRLVNEYTHACEMVRGHAIPQWRNIVGFVTHACAQQREAGRRDRDAVLAEQAATMLAQRKKIQALEKELALARQPVSEWLTGEKIAKIYRKGYDDFAGPTQFRHAVNHNDYHAAGLKAVYDAARAAPPAKAEGMIYHVIDDSGADDCRVASYASVSEAEQGRLKIARSSPNERFAITKTGGGIIRRPMNLEELQRAEKRQRVIAFSCNLRAQFPNDPENQCDKWCGCEETCTASFAAPVAILAQQAKGEQQ